MKMRASFLMRKNIKMLALGSAVLGLTAGSWISYQQLFTKGLDHLPAEVCDGAARRDTVIRLLPDTRSAEEDGETHGAGDTFMFGCHVYAGDDSLLSGEVKIQDSSRQAWETYYKSYGGPSQGSAEQTSASGIYALSRGKFASIYVPCVPSGSNPDDASQAYALISEVRVIGESRASGLGLHQALTDFAYELTRHAYDLGKCENGQSFPDKLPRWAES
ncbi:hypothetical protein J2X68_007315 [Streptomyces sp. 3330]|uniref:hypothetical protein n=1 Tax=Streptomyces sp. 3330 TaxID=2817755 RepID=UPI002861BB29|nr:hypothetical protein [Streptomyces sp. 3330]MDR6980575.1 hypothetical protein [Streptomyces sp. 3330]